MGDRLKIFAEKRPLTATGLEASPSPSLPHEGGRKGVVIRMSDILARMSPHALTGENLLGLAVLEPCPVGFLYVTLVGGRHAPTEGTLRMGCFLCYLMSPTSVLGRACAVPAARPHYLHTTCLICTTVQSPRFARTCSSRSLIGIPEI